MPEPNFLAPARRQMRDILEWSEKTWDEATADRYADLLFQAMDDVAENPYRLGTKSLESVDKYARFYHIEHSKKRVNDPVQEPRHYVVFEPTADSVDILGFFYDSIPLHLGLRRVLDSQ